MASSLFLLSVFLILSAAFAVTVVMPEASASPEPDMPDPLPGTMALYIVPAGPISSGMLLGATATVCPADYPSGYSIECRSSNPTATFYVNGDGVRKEMKKPFYIAGDAKGMVRPWKVHGGEKAVWVACKYSGERVRSRITLAC